MNKEVKQANVRARERLIFPHMLADSHKRNFIAIEIFYELTFTHECVWASERVRLELHRERKLKQETPTFLHKASKNILARMKHVITHSRLPFCCYFCYFAFTSDEFELIERDKFWVFWDMNRTYNIIMELTINRKFTRKFK